MVYNGKARTQPILVTSNYAGKEKALKEGTDYIVSYSNNKAIGTATVTVKGKGSYIATVKKTFKIVPKSTTLNSIKSTKKGRLTVQWKIQTQTSGYQIQYARNSKFTSGKAAKTIASNKTIKKTYSGLKSGKKYWVRVRAYKTVNGKKYYSAWSKAKKVTVR